MGELPPKRSVVADCPLLMDSAGLPHSGLRRPRGPKLTEHHRAAGEPGRQSDGHMASAIDLGGEFCRHRFAQVPPTFSEAKCRDLVCKESAIAVPIGLRYVFSHSARLNHGARSRPGPGCRNGANGGDGLFEPRTFWKVAMPRPLHADRPNSTVSFCRMISREVLALPLGCARPSTGFVLLA
jgi:hypothetical protein